MCGDIKNFYLGNKMKWFKYMKIHLSQIPEEIIQQYNLREIAQNGYVYMEIQGGMYGLPQAGIIANDQLKTNLANHGYYQCRHTPGLWRHKW